MALKDDWFRKPCLTVAAQAGFEHRLARTRGQRPEYPRIQACALREAGAHAPALALLDRLRVDHPDHLVAWIEEDRARCLAGLGRNEEAIAAYDAAIAADPHRRGNAPIGYAALVDRLDRADLYETALTRLTDFWDAAPIFPAAAFEQFGWTAILLDWLGHREDAVPPARRALAEAARQRSGAAHHPDLGLVTDHHAALRRRLDRIVAAAPAQVARLS